VPAELPRDSVAFTGRGAEMDRLVRAVMRTEGSGVIAVHAVAGMAGVGKTAFAVHAGHALAERFPDGQLFVRLHAHTPGQEPADPADVLASLLVNDGVTASMVPVLADTRATLEARASLWRSRMAGRRALLVLDDAADEGQVRPLFPGAPGCLVLITSRRRLVGLPDAVAVALDTLPPPEAVRLFIRLSEVGGRRLSPAEHRVVAELVDRCGHLPLAIAVLAGRLRQHPAWRLSDLLAELDAAHSRLAVLRVRDIAVAAALDLSYERLPPERQRLFRRMSLHPGTDLDAYAAAALDDIDPAEASSHLEALHDEHLLVETAPGRYRMHDLVREYTMGRCAEDPASESDKARERLLDFYQRMVRAADSHISHPGTSRRVWGPDAAGIGPELPDRRAAMAWMQAESLNVLAVAADCRQANDHGRLIALAATMATYLRLAGPWDRAIALHQAAAEAADKLGDSGRQADALVDLGLVQYYADYAPRALEAVTSALGIYERCDDRRGQGRALNLLGVLFGNIDNYAEGEAANRRALEIFQEIGDRHGEAVAHMEIGATRTLMGDYTAAEEDLTRALTIYVDVDDREAQGLCYNYLGTLLLLRCSYPAAVDALGRAMQIADQIGDRDGFARAHGQLSAVRRLTGDYYGALAAAATAAEIYGDIGNRGGEGVSLCQIGVVRRLTGDYSGASDVLARAHQIFVEIESRYDESTALTHLGAVRRLTGDYLAASDMLSRAMEICVDAPLPSTRWVRCGGRPETTTSRPRRWPPPWRSGATSATRAARPRHSTSARR
jgi:tetratricopeptide (TPR) repeat protein